MEEMSVGQWGGRILISFTEIRSTEVAPGRDGARGVLAGGRVVEYAGWNL